MMHIITQAYYLTGIAILIAFINHHTIRLQPAIGVMLASLLTSLGLLFLNKSNAYTLPQELIKTLHHLNFQDILMYGLLSFLLFAGSLSMSIEFFKKAKLEIASLAIVSTISSTFIIAGLIYWSLMLLNQYLLPSSPHIPFFACLLFGALISPTDPIAVIATLKNAKAPKAIETILAGESLFNDGVGIVIFLTLYSIIFEHQHTNIHSVLSLFIKQSIGGISFGLCLGYFCSFLIHTIKKDDTLPILLTISVVTGGYALCQWLNFSGPLAMVAAGILVAHRCPRKSYELLYMFWELIDELLNIILFFLIGFEILIIQWSVTSLVAMLLAIMITLLTRIITVFIPIKLINKYKPQTKNTCRILVWGGLRGGLAVALALSIPNTYPYQDIIIAMTYAVVVFSILIQGTTVPLLLKIWHSKPMASHQNEDQITKN